MRHTTIKGWILKLKKDGIKKRFLRWIIPIILKKHHLAANPVGGGRKKKVEVKDV